MPCGYWRFSARSLRAICAASLFVSPPGVYGGTDIFIDGSSTWPDQARIIRAQENDPTRLIFRPPVSPSLTAKMTEPSVIIRQPAYVYVPEHASILATPKSYSATNLADEIKGHYTINFVVYAFWFAVFGAVLATK